MQKRKLILEDGSVYEGIAFGDDTYQVGELVFNTGMSGYQEVLSDLSYCGQIVLMTYPLIMASIEMILKVWIPLSLALWSENTVKHLAIFAGI